jgi:rhodanese-related sulfurtransferase
MSVHEYFKSRLEATFSPMDIQKILKQNPESICIVDVRIGPATLLKEKIKGAIQIPQDQIEQRFNELPKDKIIILYCWETWCSLAVKAAVFLLEKGFTVKELYGGIAAWKTLNFPTEPIIEKSSNNNSNKYSC